jgi:hypothetical protein
MAKNLESLAKDLKALQKLAEKNASVAKGEKVEAYYNGMNEAYTDCIKRVKELDSYEADLEDTLEAKSGKSFWKGMTLGTILGGATLAFLIHWIMFVLQ